jgi:sugar lactone lactonase YvrE
MKTYARNSLLITVFLILSAISMPALAQSFTHTALTPVWTSPEGLKTPESVLFDQKRQVLYVSNINGGHSDKDGNGFISKLAPDGSIISLEWVVGLNAPKGMGISEDRLYVSDMNEVVEIDINTGKILQKYEATDGLFLNDISCDINGKVYISDMQDKKIYRLWKGKLEIWLKDDRLENVNGLLVMNDYVLAGVKDEILKINAASGAIEEMVKGTGGIDGLVTDGRGNYLFSDWSGHVYIYLPGKPIVKLLDTTPLNVNAADIEYFIDKDILLVPTFSDNHVVTYKLDISKIKE